MKRTRPEETYTTVVSHVDDRKCSRWAFTITDCPVGKEEMLLRMGEGRAKWLIMRKLDDKTLHGRIVFKYGKRTGEVLRLLGHAYDDEACVCMPWPTGTLSTTTVRDYFMSHDNSNEVGQVPLPGRKPYPRRQIVAV